MTRSTPNLSLETISLTVEMQVILANLVIVKKKNMKILFSVRMREITQSITLSPKVQTDGVSFLNTLA